MKDLSLHILDIAQNSIRAKARMIEISIFESSADDSFKLVIKDNGNGMSPEQLEKAVDPFYTSRTTRKVGLGLSLLNQNAMQSGGTMNIQSQAGIGTEVEAIFKASHIDKPVLGDIAKTIVLVTGANKEIEITYRHVKDGEEYVFNSFEIQQELDGVSISSPKILKFLEDMINQNLDAIGVDRG
jgi:anti-sigma regulatory factor (Ser/Thr protein kinase)